MKVSWKTCGLTSAWQIALALVILGCVTFGLPYLFPVTPSISLSYDAGFNNRAACVCFALGSLIFAFFLKGDIQTAKHDRPLRRSALYFALCIALALCVSRPAFVAHITSGTEVTYFLNRQYLLSMGLIPYRQFEFAYGPLLLYPGVWAAKILHGSLTAGYYLWWTASWMIGVWMLWELVRAVDIVTPHRTQIFALTCFIVYPAIASEGLNGSPLRLFCAAFVVLVVYRTCWRWRSPLWTGAAAVLGVALAFGSSPEQGLGAAAGLAMYFTYLAIRKSPVFSWTALAAMLLGFIAIFAAADHFSILTTMRAFASGGNSFPLLPTPWTCLVLGCYLSAACLFVLRLRTGKEMSVTLPLVCAGAAMLPSAMGRCDIGHLESAWPAMLVGIFAIYALLAVRRWWVPAAMCLILVLSIELPAAKHALGTVRDASELLLVGSGTPPTALQRFFWAHLGQSPAMQRRLAAISAKFVPREHYDNPAVPCDRIYLAPAYGRILGPCFDNGYFLGQENVFLPSQVQRKIDELAAYPGTPLLLTGASLQTAFPAKDSMDMLYGLEGSFYVPRQRNPSLSLAPLAQYISGHYISTTTLDGYTVWEPK